MVQCAHLLYGWVERPKLVSLEHVGMGAIRDCSDVGVSRLSGKEGEDRGQ
jgi:hypothetical protein